MKEQQAKVESQQRKGTNGPHHWFTKIHSEAIKENGDHQRIIEFASAWYHDHCEDIEHWNDDRAKMIDLQAELANERNTPWYEKLWGWCCALVS